MNLRAQVEPWQDLRIDITATLSDAGDMNSFWRFGENLDNFTEQNKNVTGNYNISFFAIPGLGPFQCTFVQLRSSSNSGQPNGDLEGGQDRAARDPNYAAEIIGSADSTNYGYDDYSLISQNV